VGSALVPGRVVYCFLLWKRLHLRHREAHRPQAGPGGSGGVGRETVIGPIGAAVHLLWFLRLSSWHAEHVIVVAKAGLVNEYVCSSRETGRLPAAPLCLIRRQVPYPARCAAGFSSGFLQACESSGWLARGAASRQPQAGHSGNPGRRDARPCARFQAWSWTIRSCRCRPRRGSLSGRRRSAPGPRSQILNFCLQRLARSRC